MRGGRVKMGGGWEGGGAKKRPPNYFGHGLLLSKRKKNLYEKREKLTKL